MNLQTLCEQAAWQILLLEDLPQYKATNSRCDGDRGSPGRTLGDCEEDAECLTDHVTPPAVSAVRDITETRPFIEGESVTDASREPRAADNYLKAGTPPVGDDGEMEMGYAGRHEKEE
jgi:hypothetical protein